MPHTRLKFGRIGNGGVLFSPHGGKFVTFGKIDGAWTLLDRTDNLGDALGAATHLGERLGVHRVESVTVHEGSAMGWLHGLVDLSAGADFGQPGVDAKTPVLGEHP